MALPPPPINDKPGTFAWLEWYRQLRNYISTSGSVPWYIINFAGSKLTDLAERSHNQLQAIQGGTAGEEYHLTATQHSLLLTSDEHERLLNPDYGEMYATNNSYTITVSATNTPYEVDGGLGAGELNKITFPDDHYLQITNAGTYLVNWSMTIGTATASNEIEGGVMVNETAQTKGTSHTHVGIVSLGTAIAASTILTLAANDQVSLFVRNHTAATNIVMEHASCTITRLI